VLTGRAETHPVEVEGRHTRTSVYSGWFERLISLHVPCSRNLRSRPELCFVHPPIGVTLNDPGKSRTVPANAFSFGQTRSCGIGGDTRLA
jgi:hypothetical protein